MQRRGTSPNSVYFLAIVALLCIGFLPVNSSSFSTSVIQLAKIGENVTFSSCNISEKSVFTRLKYSDNRSFRSPYRIADVLRGTVDIGKPFEARLSVESSGLLMLHNVSVKDRGFYSCSMNFEDGRDIERVIHLKVGVQPVIRHFSMTNIAILEDSPLRFYCIASGEPTPDVFWYKSNRGLGYDIISTTGTLERNTVRLSDSGNYHCRANNYMGGAVRTLKIQVYEKPKVTEFFNTAAVDGTICECETVSFTCEARDSRPAVETFQIHHNGRPIINDSETGTFTIEKVRMEHNGQYSCVPRNNLGLGENSTIVLKVKAAPYNCKHPYSSSSSPVVNTAKNNFSGHSVAPSVTHDHKSSSCQRQNRCLVLLLLSLIYAIHVLCP